MDVKYNLPKREAGGGTSLKDLGYEDFDPAESYAAGDVVIYNNGLKKFTTAHEGAWDDDDATDTSVAQESALASTALQPADIVDDLESLESDKPISARAVNEDMVNYVDQSITDTMRYIDQQDNSEHAGRVAGDNILDGKISGLSKLVNADGYVEDFDSTRRYVAGSYCIKDGYIYRFEVTHEAGPWNTDHVLQTSVLNELSSMVVGDMENIYIQLQSSDGELELEGLQVQVTFEDGSPTQMLTADEDGKCNISVEKAKTITLSVADQLGYQHVSSITLRTTSNSRYVYFTYEKDRTSETCTVRVQLVPSGGRPELYSSFSGKTVNLILSDGTSRSAVTDSNYIATFENVTKGVDGYTGNPKVTGFVTPRAKTFGTSFDEINLSVTYDAIAASGIFMVNQDGDDITYEAWDTADTLVALHIATAALAEAGCDYYVPVEELVGGWFTSAHYKAWASSDVKFPHVKNYSASAPYYDGAEATQNMIIDAAALEVQTPAAEFAIEQRFTLKGITAHGYIGTRDQFQIILDNSEAIYNMLLIEGYTTHYKSREIWTSSQNGESSAHVWFDGAWNSTSYNINKERVRYIIPFFRI